MYTDIVRHVTVIIVPEQIPVPDYFSAFFPALRDCEHYSPCMLNEVALELTINGEFYGTLYKTEEGYYPELYIPLNVRPATFSVKGVRSGKHFRSVTVPQGTEEYEVVFCEGYPSISDKGRQRPQRNSLALMEYDTTRLLFESMTDELQPDGEIYAYMTRPEVLLTRLTFIDGGAMFHHITDTRNPVYFPTPESHYISFHKLNHRNPDCTRTYIGLNDEDCCRLQHLAERLLPVREDLQHLEFFTEDGCLCMRPK